MVPAFAGVMFYSLHAQPQNFLELSNTLLGRTLPSTSWLVGLDNVFAVVAAVEVCVVMAVSAVCAIETVFAVFAVRAIVAVRAVVTIGAVVTVGAIVATDAIRAVHVSVLVWSFHGFSPLWPGCPGGYSLSDVEVDHIFHAPADALA